MVWCADLELISKKQEYNRRRQALTEHWSEQEINAEKLLADAEDKFFWLNSTENDNPKNMDAPEGVWTTIWDWSKKLQYVQKPRRASPRRSSGRPTRRSTLPTGKRWQTSGCNTRLKNDS